MRALISSFSFWVVFVIVAAPVIAWYGPQIEDHLLPVLGPQVVTVARSGNTVEFIVAVEKRRECQLLSAAYSVFRGTNRVPIAVETSAGTTTTTTTTYLPGKYNLGPFRAKLPPGFENADAIEGALYYQCHPFWQTFQIFGPIPVPPQA